MAFAAFMEQFGLSRKHPRHIAILLMAFGVAMLDTYHLLFMALGAAFFYLVQPLELDTNRQPGRAPGKSGKFTTPMASYREQSPSSAHSARRHGGIKSATPQQQHQHTPFLCKAGGEQAPDRRGAAPSVASPWQQRQWADEATRGTGMAAREVHHRTLAHASDTHMLRAGRVPQMAGVGGGSRFFRVGGTTGCLSRPVEAVAPVARPQFKVSGLEAEVQELMPAITPCSDSLAAVETLRGVVEKGLKSLVPVLDVVGFAHGAVKRGKAFGVAVPDIDLVVTVNPELLIRCLHGRCTSSSYCAKSTDSFKLMKSSIRAFTEQLVWRNGFKFRRSAFRGIDPKVTLLSPPCVLGFEEGIPVDIYVNAATPIYAASLLSEVCQLEQRAMQLILLVRRWAQDRGVCHAAKGHFSPYIWSLLTIFYLQVGDGGQEAAVLPAFDGMPASAGLAARSAAGSVQSGALPFAVARAVAAASKDSWGQHQKAAFGGAMGNISAQKTAASLFKDFILFYARTFDWQTEAVSVRLGKRAPPDCRLPLHIIGQEDGYKRTEVGPSIEDPFDPKRNLGACMNAASLCRLREELSRADEMLSRSASLTDLLEPWTPSADQENKEDGDAE